jgi:histidine phosphotransfer protein HptB
MNIEELARTIELDEETYLQLLKLFYERSTSDLMKIESAFRDGFSQGVADAAHSIKGAAASLAIQEISEQAKQVEIKGRQDDLNGVEGMISVLKQKVGLIKDVIELGGQQLQ